MIHGNDPTGYDYDAADQLKANSRGLAIAIEDQSDSRSEARSGASTDFSGYFADVFDANADLASEGAVKLASALRSLAVAVGKLEEAARQEDARRQDARAWAERQQYREDHLLADAWNEVGSFIEGVGSRLGEIGSHLGWGDDPQPPDPEPEPQIQADSVHLAARDVSGGHGEGGGVSSARPENLRSFQSGIHSLDDDLATPLASLTQSLADYEAGCNSSWGTLSAQPLADSVKKWIADNGHDAEWAGTLADQFEAAGGSGGVVSLSDASLQAALERAGISVSRDDLTIGAYSAMGTPPTNGFSDDPVNTATGNFIEPECDLTGSGVASSLHLSRMYNALDDRRGVFGQGWASNLDMRLAFDQTGADFIDEDGRQIHFPRSGDSWQRAIGGNYWLTRIESLPDGAAFEQDLSLNGDGVLAVRDNAGSWWAFDRVGRLIAQGHGPGTVVSFGRDTDGRVTRLEHERGRVITIGYEDGLVASAEGCDGQRVAYRYDEANRLVAAEGTDGVRRYRWNEAGVIDRVTAADGTVECENTYDDRGRVIGQQTPFGRRVRFAYLQGGVTSVSDERGDGANTWISDRYGRVVGIVDANGNRQSMAYDRNGNLVMVTSREGKTTLHSYDGRGRRVRTVTPEGMDVTYAWDGHDRITRVTTAQGGVVEYEYVNDLERNPSIVRDPGGGVTKLDWSDGLLLRVVDPEGVSIDLDYDEYGDLIAVTNAEGDTARFERDDAGRVTRAINPLGAVTSLTYETGGDATGLTAGLTIRRREADGGVWRYEYEFGHLIRLVDPLGAVTEYGYGPGEVVSSVSDPLGRVTTGSVDEYGNVCGVRLPSGERWAFAHDGLSRLREITDPDGGVWKREYTADGLIASVCDPTGRVTTFSRDGDGVRVCDACDHASFAFDAFGRPTRRESGDGSSALTAYDVCGRPVELVDGEGGLTRVGYDLARRVTLVTSPAGRTTRWEYDRCGRPSARIEPDGARTTLHYDRASRLVGVVGPTGRACPTSTTPLAGWCGRASPAWVPRDTPMTGLADSSGLATACTGCGDSNGTTRDS